MTCTMSLPRHPASRFGRLSLAVLCIGESFPVLRRPKNWPPYLPYLALALISALASVAIVFIAMIVLEHNGGQISDGGMHGIAAMAAAPAVMGIGIASCLPRDRN